jgi:hypothetical protein
MHSEATDLVETRPGWEMEIQKSRFAVAPTFVFKTTDGRDLSVRITPKTSIDVWRFQRVIDEYRVALVTSSRA